ncbi:MAG: TIM barrel protein [Nitrospirae bacterium]|nr:TIM barrel protein [Nitrospirota bacterium]
MRRANTMSYSPVTRSERKMAEAGRIRVGNQTAFSAPILTTPFAYAVENGFDAFEWFPDKKESGEGWTETDLSAETRAYIRETARARDIRLSVHGSWQSDPPEQKGAGALDRAAALAQEIGAALLNVHLYTGNGIAGYLSALVPLATRLARSGIRLSVENTPDTGPEDFNEFFALLRKTEPGASAFVGMCFDIGHANLHPATRNDYLRFLDLLDKEVPIIHVHMHENYGDCDSHLTVFTGPAGKDPSGIEGFIDRLGARGFTGSVILEQWPEPPALLNQARERLLGIIRKRIKTEGTGGETAKTEGRDTDKCVGAFVEANNRFRSWRKRLEWIEKLLSGSPSPPDPDLLAYIAVYLRFIGTGEIPCGEDGGHYRPSYHARTSHRIYALLAGSATQKNALVLRKIYPWLPSFDREFMRAEPLTRIRDIAHRNDIPRELKDEIKHTLQNKLHRSAGPEDLAASGALLKRITAPGASYPTAFIEEFRKFDEELRDFFHAGSLEEQLGSVLRKGHAADAGLIREFLEAKGRGDSPEDTLITLELLTELRRSFSERLPGSGSAGEQRLQLADIRLEEFSFVLLSRLINSLGPLNSGMSWARVLRCLALAIENLGLGGIEPEECSSIVSELGSWSQAFDPGETGQLLRLKATLDRCLRLADTYCGRILALFPEKAGRLGRALGVQEHAIRVFSEADIRSHLVFQISKLAAVPLREIRSRAALPPWNVIARGRVSGRLIASSHLAGLPDLRDAPVIALLEKTEGDEEIPLFVGGIVSARETPRLSHLAVRARQQGVVFAESEDRDGFSKVKDLVGKEILFEASADGVRIETVTIPERMSTPRNRLRRVEAPEVALSGQRPIPLDGVTAETGGNKAFAARRLQELAGREGAGFRTPAGCVIPFGARQEALRTDPSFEEEYLGLASALHGLADEELAAALRRLREMTGRLRLPRETERGITGIFGRKARLMVRSSSNCEDLEGFSGAGLYDSVANVLLNALGDAVRRVWASLWNRRAFSARRDAGIPEDKAHMAVLIEEMLDPELSCIMHTRDPVGGGDEEVSIEIAAGLGETLASGRAQGAPYRMVFHKRSGEVRVLSFSSFSNAARPAPEGGIVYEHIDHSRIRLSVDRAYRERVARGLGKIGTLVEEAFGQPQDIEGVLVKDTVYLVQSRQQAGL